MIPAVFLTFPSLENVCLNYAAVIWALEQMAPVEPSPLSNGDVSLQLSKTLEPMFQLKYILFLQNQPSTL